MPQNYNKITENIIKVLESYNAQVDPFNDIYVGNESSKTKGFIDNISKQNINLNITYDSNGTGWCSVELLNVDNTAKRVKCNIAENTSNTERLCTLSLENNPEIKIKIRQPGRPIIYSYYNLNNQVITNVTSSAIIIEGLNSNVELIQFKFGSEENKNIFTNPSNFQLYGTLDDYNINDKFELVYSNNNYFFLRVKSPDFNNVQHWNYNKTSQNAYVKCTYNNVDYQLNFTLYTSSYIGFDIYFIYPGTPTQQQINMNPYYVLMVNINAKNDDFSGISDDNIKSEINRLIGNNNWSGFQNAFNAGNYLKNNQPFSANNWQKFQLKPTGTNVDKTFYGADNFTSNRTINTSRLLYQTFNNCKLPKDIWFIVFFSTTPSTNIKNKVPYDPYKIVTTTGTGPFGKDSDIRWTNNKNVQNNITIELLVYSESNYFTNN